MKIHILYFAQLREAMGKIEEVKIIDDHTTISDLKEGFQIEMPIQVAINGNMVGVDHPLQDGDEVAFLPPMSGG